MEPIPACFSEPRKQHPLHDRFREFHTEIEQIVGVSQGYLVNASVGQGNWAQVPWVAVFDKLVTTSAQRGYYVVYLFSNDGQRVYLSLNQGTTEAHEQFGKAYIDALAGRAAEFWLLIGDRARQDLLPGAIDLSATQVLGRGYAAGNITAIEYRRDQLPNEDKLVSDLRHVLDLYEYLIYGKGIGAPEEIEIPSASNKSSSHESQIEARRMRIHVRVERNRKLADDAKKFHGTVCKACGFDFGERYGERGQGYIEAHHLTSLSELRGRPTALNPETDFTVLCSNCHAMVHRTLKPLTISELKRLIR